MKGLIWQNLENCSCVIITGLEAQNLKNSWTHRSRL